MNLRAICSYILLFSISFDVIAADPHACFHDYVGHPDKEHFQKLQKQKFHLLKPLGLKKAFYRDTSDKDDGPGRKQDYTIGLKLLFLSVLDNDTDPAVGLAKRALQGYSIPFDHMTLMDKSGNLNTGSLPLYDNEGKPKYYGIILSNAELGFTDKNGVYKSGMNSQQWDQLRNYEQRYDVRRVALYSFPMTLLGVERVEAPGAEAQELKLSENAQKLDTSIKSEGTLPLTGAWHYEARLYDPEVAEPFIMYKKGDDQEETLASVIARYEDGREQLHFFFTQSVWIKASEVLNGLWINWVTKGLYLGKRRAYLNVQVDDFFLATTLWDTEKQTQVRGKKSHRLSSSELNHFTEWQNNQFRNLAKNPEYRIEIAFNGHGTVLYDKLNDTNSLYETSKKLFKDYFWLSHTYTHADLNTTSYEETLNEANRNIGFKNRFVKMIEGYSRFYSALSMVTPRISGLLRKESLSALWDAGIRFVTGDNTRSELLPEMPYVGRYTTEKDNHFAGMLIIPRHATEIYYNASTPEELLSEYNFVYEAQMKKKSDLEEVYARENIRATSNILAFDPASYMFHQSNMRVFEYQGKKVSLLSLWMEKVVTELRKFSNLPLLSLKMDDLKDVYLDRMALEKCKVSALGVVENGKMVKINLSSKADCRQPITGLENRNFEVEHYGPDVTTTLPMRPNNPLEIVI